MKLLILSGLPGSGTDEYIRKNFIEKGIQHQVFSADDYFSKTGKYIYDPTKIKEAHDECLMKFIEAVRVEHLMLGIVKEAVLIINNTNTTTLEIAPYYLIASAYGVEVSLLTLETMPEVAEKRNVHGVPFGICVAMYENLNNRKLPEYWKIDVVAVKDENVLQYEKERMEAFNEEEKHLRREKQHRLDIEVYRRAEMNELIDF